MREKILHIIETNALIDVRDVAIMLGTSEIEVANCINEMVSDKTICGYNTMINWDNTKDEKVIALIEVKVTPQRGQGFDKLAERIYNYDEVSSLYLMSGAFDFTVIIEGKSLKEVSSFVSSKLAPMDSVLSTATHFVLKKYKEHKTVFVKESVDERMIVTP